MTYYSVFDASARANICADLERVPITFRLYGLEINYSLIRGIAISVILAAVPVFVKVIVN
jgi:hypothetical protein